MSTARPTPSPRKGWLNATLPLQWVLTVPLALSTLGATALGGYLCYQNGQRAVADLGRQLVLDPNQQGRTAMPEAYVLGIIQANTHYTLGLLLLTLGTTIALGALLTQVVLTRLRQFNRASQGLAAGNLSHRLSTTGRIGEFNELARSFNQMADQLQQSFQRVQTALEESEAQLTTSPSERARLEVERKHSEAQRQQTEKALQESETRFRQLAEAVEEGFFVYDVEAAHYAYVNPAYWAIRGMAPDYSPDSEAQWLAHIHPDDRDRVVAALERERQGENFDQEYRYITPDGELRWLRSKAFPLLSEAGNVVRVVGTVENVTDRKLTEAALRQSEARFRSAFNDAPYGISLVDTAGQFVLVNAYYCALLGYSETELLSLTFKDITHPEDRADDWVGFQQMMNDNTGAHQIEKRYITKQSEEIPVIISAAPIYDDEGKLLYSVGHVQDVRDRLAIDRLKDEFISVVSHELRTPITSIRGALALLGAGVYGDRPEKARHMLNIAINNSDRLVRLVDDILSFERLESGKVQLEKEQCQVAQLMYQALDSVQPLADQSGITIALTPLTATLWAAPDAIVQVLTNLLSNAIKFSRPGETVWLKAEVGSGEWRVGSGEVGQVTPTLRSGQPSSPPHPLTPSPLSPHLLLTVQDQGRGIPADKLEVIFEQFQQVDVSDSRQRGGTGLGLAICKRIVQQHQGHIWATSAVGEGSTFCVALPLTGDAAHD